MIVNIGDSVKENPSIEEIVFFCLFENVHNLILYNEMRSIKVNNKQSKICGLKQCY